MSATAAVVERAVAVATITTPRGSATAIVTERAPVATVAGGQGPAGPPGPPAAPLALIVRQSAPSASWVIPHPLGRRPLVQITDDADEIVFPNVIAGSTVVTVIFAQPATGSVILF